MLDRISAILAFAKGPDVLDVGCAGGLQDIGDLDPTRTRSDPAYGRWLHGHLARQFDGLVGIDINEKKVAAMRSLGYEVVVGNAQDIGLNRSFDTIVAGELIEHLFDPGAFLQSATRHLKPGGRLVLSTPYPHGLLNVLYAWIKYPKTCSNPEHTMWLCPSTLAVLAGIRTRHGQVRAS